MPRKTCIGISKHPPRQTGKKEWERQKHIQMSKFRHTNRESRIGISKHPLRHTSKKSEKDKNTYKRVDLDTKTEKDMHWNKQTPTQTHIQKE
jgi:hypothetical protein